MGETIQKRLLLIAPLFFGYYKEIIKEAEFAGFQVEYICDAPSNSSLSKALGRINKKFIRIATEKYFNHTVLLSLKGKQFDNVLVIAGMTFAFSGTMVKKIREMYPCAKFSLYQWDSERNLPYCAEIHPYFDKIFSFDRYDCMHNGFYHFLPLFYTGMYEEIGKNRNTEFTYDCSYVGTAHPQKYRDINRIAQACSEVLPNQLIYHYMPSRLKFVYHKLLSPEYKFAKLADFKMKKVSFQKLMDIIQQSKCILDAPQAGQTGLTIRTIECLGARKKLITTNADVKYYDFYRENNILIFNGEIDKLELFFTEPYSDIPVDIYKKYSLRSWLNTILE